MPPDDDLSVLTKIQDFANWMYYRKNCAHQRRYSKISTTFGVIGGLGIALGQGDVNIFSWIGLIGIGMFALIELIFVVLPLIAMIIYTIGALLYMLVTEKLLG